MTYKTPRQTIKAATECMAMNLLDYDVRDGEDLPAGGIVQAIKNGAATTDEVIGWFSAELRHHTGDHTTKDGARLSLLESTVAELSARLDELEEQEVHTDGGR